MSEPAPTRLDARPTRLDGPQRAAPGAPHSTFNLPGALAANWKIVRPLPAGGAEAELLIVQRLDGPEQAVAKLYRPGIRPPLEALALLTGAVANDVVRTLEHGQSDGVDYELMEYCVAGSLADHLADAARDLGFARRVLERLAPALDHLHGVGLIHRDLKPANILVRTREPLDLVLTDFGISSIADGTVHFTSTSRTVRYAPPEAMTGVLSFKADHWSLGMILLEIVLGRHPFEGLSEAVINHQLMTRSIDFSGVHDPAWQSLLRGLLLRDPDKRWGGAELQRWLAGDPSLAFFALPADELRSSVRPYKIGTESCHSAEALVLALIGHWDIGVKDLARGFVSSWLRDELRDQNLVRRLLDLMDASMSPDQRLLRFALQVLPDLPATWKGMPLGDDSLQSVVRQALAGSPAHNEFLQDLFAADALAIYAQNDHAEAPRLSALRTRWTARVASYQETLTRLRQAEAEGPQPGVDESSYVNFDALRHQPPAVQAVPALPHALLLAPEFAPEHVADTRLRLTALIARLADDAAWFASLGMPAEASIETLAVLDGSQARATQFAERLHAQRERELRQQHELARSTGAQLRGLFEMVRGLAEQGPGSTYARSTLGGLHDDYAKLHAQAFADGPAPQAFAAVRQALRRSGSLFRRIQINVNRLNHLDNIRDVVLQRGWGFGAAFLFVAAMLHQWTLFMVLAVSFGLSGLLYLWLRAHASAEIRRCAQALPRDLLDEPPAAPLTSPASAPEPGKAAATAATDKRAGQGAR